MTRFAYIADDAGAGNARFFKRLRDRKNGRTLNVTTNTWKATVGSSDQKLFLSQSASPFLGIYARELALGPVGEIYEYTCDANDSEGRPFRGQRRYISDGAYANTPDAADSSLQGKAHFEYIHGLTGLGPNRLFKRAIDHAAGEMWNQHDNLWEPIGDVSDTDSRIFMIPESGDFANVYGTDLEGMGSRQEIWLYDFDAQISPNQVLSAERFRLVNGTVTSGGSLPPFKLEALKAHGVLTNVDRLDPDNEPDTILTVNALASPTYMGRIVDSTGTPILAAAISAISYSVYELRPFEPGYSKPVPGHYRVALTPAAVLNDVLQLDFLWGDLDETGYNFRAQPSNSVKQAFADRGKTYAIVFTLTPQSGEVFDFRFLVKTKA
jgi:hypothetical protein